MSTKKIAITLGLIMTIGLIATTNSCHAQCCLPMPPIPWPFCWFVDCPQPCRTATKPAATPPAKEQVEEAACTVKVEPKVTPTEHAPCPAMPFCGTCHDADKIDIEHAEHKTADECDPMLVVSPEDFPTVDTMGSEPIVPTEIGKNANEPQVIPPEFMEAAPLLEDLAFAPAGTDDQVVACFNAINDLRRKNNMKPVEMDVLLCKTAQAHSDRMAQFRAMFHSGCGFCENVAFGNSDGLRTFEQWHHSWGHLQNLLRNGKRIGLARCGIYWTFIIAN